MPNTLANTFLPTLACCCCVAAWVDDDNEGVEGAEILALRRHIEKKGGVVSENVRVIEDALGNRGIQAVGSGVDEGELILSVPWEVTIVGSGEKEEEDVSMAELHLFLQLLKELHDPVAKHKPYLNTLPGTFTNGPFWDEIDAQCLSPNSKVHHSHTVKQLERFGAIALEVQKTQPESFFGARKFSREELYAAYSVVFTRALRSGNDAVLIPFFDMLNHASDPTVSVSFTEVGVTVSALDDIPPGEELKISYGSHLTPAMMLVYYGFADNSFTNVSSHFNFEVTPRTAPLVDIGCTNQADLVIFRNGTLSEKLVECLVLTVLPLPNSTAYTTLPYPDQQITIAENRLTALQVYAPHLVQITSQYPSPYDAPCDTSHGHIPLIQASNDMIREVYLAAKQIIDDEVKESGHVGVEVKGKGKKKRRRRREEEEEGKSSADSEEF